MMTLIIVMEMEFVKLEDANVLVKPKENIVNFIIIKILQLIMIFQNYQIVEWIIIKLLHKKCKILPILHKTIQ